jgi:xanthine dehydrogenase molybdopterin-binding subunit B
METQSTLATPIDGDAWEFIVSDSDCNTTQLCLAAILGVPAHKINIKTPRAGGSFGGKLTRQLIAAGPAAVAAHKLGRPVQIQNERSDDLQVRLQLFWSRNAIVPRVTFRQVLAKWQNSLMSM